MGANSKIEWTDHTFNPWIGCTEVSAACDFCYARTMSERYGWAQWGNYPRHRTSASTWKQPLKWNREAAKAGVRKRVFCASLADVFDNQVPEHWRRDLFVLIEETPNLDWLLLTKRPQNISRMNTPFFREHPPLNVWLGTTIENRDEMHKRARHLKSIPARIHFWSAEPLLEDLGDISPSLMPDWIIVGGESGAHWRPMQNEWAESLMQQCAATDAAFFMKQMAGRKPEKELARFPESLRVRQFPVCR